MAEANRSVVGDRPRPPFQALNGRFLRRTALATLLTVALVAMTAAVYDYPAWGGYYLFAGVWMLAFLSLTPLILKAMMFDRRPGVGLGLIVFKVLLVAVMIGALSFWTRRETGRLRLGSALVAGLVTPLAVVVLRVLGGALRPPSDKAKPMTEGKP